MDLHNDDDGMKWSSLQKTQLNIHQLSGGDGEIEDRKLIEFEQTKSIFGF